MDNPALEAIFYEEPIPKTFEEWVEIHGEPEYLYEKMHKYTKLNILVENCEEPEYDVNTEGIIYDTKNGRKELNYPKFIDVFTQVNPIVYNNGAFYAPTGFVPKDTVKQDIHMSLFDSGWTSRLDVPTNSIYESLKSHCYREKLPVDDTVIPLSNGDLHLNKNAPWVFHLDEFKQCPYRLSVRYIPQDKPMPLFQKWLDDMFEPEDIETIQDIFGYCLVPVTAAQEAFILVGDGGVGKSGMGAILRGLMGNAFASMETQQLVTERFQIATVENKLVAYDDDLGSAALTETGLLKKLITADVPIQAERKYADPHEFKSYCRIVASANFMLSSLYDSSDAFYRRLHPIAIKRRDPNRKNIARFYETILEQESEQILRWALEGLQRVMDNGWQITWTERSREYLAQAKSNSVHYPEFMEDVCDFGEGDITSAEFKSVYKSWCKANGIIPTSDKRLEKWLADNAEKYNMIHSRHIKRGNKEVRGYTHCVLKQEWNNSKIVF